MHPVGRPAGFVFQLPLDLDIARNLGVDGWEKCPPGLASPEETDAVLHHVRNAHAPILCLRLLGDEKIQEGPRAHDADAVVLFQIVK